MLGNRVHYTFIFTVLWSYLSLLFCTRSHRIQMIFKEIYHGMTETPDRWVLRGIEETLQPVQGSPASDPEVCVHGRTACPYPGVVACICRYWLHPDGKHTQPSKGRCEQWKGCCHRPPISHRKIASTQAHGEFAGSPWAWYYFNFSGPNHCQFERPRQHRKPTSRCYRCQKEGHVSSKCPENGDRGEMWAPLSPREKWNSTSQWCVYASTEWCVIHWLTRGAHGLLWGVRLVAQRVGTRQKCWPLTEKAWPAGEWLVSIGG